MKTSPPVHLRALALAALAVAALAAGCEARRAPGEGRWERFDLCRKGPEGAPDLQSVRIEGGEGSGGRALACGAAYLGPFEVRPAERLARQKKRRVDHLAAGEIQALRQARGTGATWKLDLGTEPYLSFVPLQDSERPCACLQRVEVRAGGEPAVEVFRGEPKSPEPFAPATVQVDLERFAGRAIELTLIVDPIDSVDPIAPTDPISPIAPNAPVNSAVSARSGAGGMAPSKALWGSPAVYHRGAVPRPLRVAGPPNVLLLGIDTLRADALGAYGRNPSVTPALDRLAGESDVWLDAYSCFNVTNPSFASLLTGLYGKDHGVYDFNTPLPPERITLAEIFGKAGFQTSAILSIDHLRNAQSGLGQGFDRFVEAREQRAGEAAVDLAMDWIGGRREPFFLWLHLFDPHTPHTPPEPFATGSALQKASGLTPPGPWKAFRPRGSVPYRNVVLGGATELYTGEVAYTDRQIDRLLGFLRSRGLLANTIVVVVADHGENLEDHGVSYRHSGLWDTTTHVPLMIRWPGESRQGRRLRGLVQNVDVFPTLLGAAGLPVPVQDGLDLRRLTGPAEAGRPGGTGRRAVFAEHTGRLGAMVRTARYKYMTSLGNRLVPDGHYLYDLEKDPGELENLAGRALSAEKELAALLDRWLASRGAALAGTTAEPLSPAEEARLRALGYL